MPSASYLTLVLFALINTLTTPLAVAQRTGLRFADNGTVRTTSLSSASRISAHTTSLRSLSQTTTPRSTSHTRVMQTTPARPTASPVHRGPPCARLRQRREWRTLSDMEKASYIKAVKCIQALPAIKPVMPQARSRYDEYQAYHVQQADSVHVTGEFLPWHRQYVKLHEDDLVHRCGYKGGIPYWDWTQDADSSKPLAAAPVFDPHTGFGGNGAPGTYSLPAPNPPADYRIIPTSYRGCVIDGPFANHTVPIGPGKYIGNHCLTRGFHEDAKAILNSGRVANATKLPTYEQFRIELEGLPITDGHRLHDGGHYAIGGEMGNFYSSPGDPLFYLHHASLDRIWWHWQNMAPGRLYEMTGRSTTKPPYVNVTLDYPLTMDSLGQSVVIRDVMDIHAEPNCYTYV